MFNFEVYDYLLKIKSKIPDFERGKAIQLKAGLTTGTPPWRGFED